MAVHIDPYVHHKVAKLVGVRGELRVVAKAVESRAKSDLAGHRDEGDSSITTSRGAVDFFVNLDDRGGGALAIEADLRVLRRAART